MVSISRWDAARLRAHARDLALLLKDGVDGDAGLGFLPPLDPADALAYWTERAADVQRGTAVLLVAEDDAGRPIGTAQLELCRRPNGRHRAEVTKVMVHSSARRRGVGLALMRALEEEARRHGRTLLHLDTFRGAEAEKLYAAAGYTFAGIIPEFALRADGKPHATAIWHKGLR